LLRMFSDWFDSPRVSQTLVFALPIGMLFLEWWLLDWVAEWLGPTRSATRPDRSATRPDRSATRPDRAATRPDPPIGVTRGSSGR
jgi:hypothetical protein